MSSLTHSVPEDERGDALSKVAGQERDAQHKQHPNPFHSSCTGREIAYDCHVMRPLTPVRPGPLDRSTVVSAHAHIKKQTHWYYGTLIENMNDTIIIFTSKQAITRMITGKRVTIVDY